MKKNAYYQQVLKPNHSQQLIIVQALLGLAQWLSMPLKVFVRKRFGERYFSFFSVCLILALLAIYPLWASRAWFHFYTWWRELFRSDEYGGFGYSRDFEWGSFLGHYLSWYLLLLACFIKAKQRQKEIEREPSVFDFARYSMSSGEVWSWFYEVPLIKKPIDIRKIETFVEPLFFFLIGVVLSYFNQYIGYYIILASLLHWWSLRTFYRMGDHFLMDQIDEMICNEDLAHTFLDAKDDGSDRGFRFYGYRPADPEHRQRLFDNFLDDDEAVEVR